MVGPNPPMNYQYGLSKSWVRKGPSGTGKIDWNVEWPKAFGHLLATNKNCLSGLFCLANDV